MKTLLFLILMLTSLGGFAMPNPNSSPDARHFKKVIWLVFENADTQDVLNQTHFRQLTQWGALLTRMSAETHPSQGNYIAMIAGSTRGVSDDDNVDLSGAHVGDLLEKAGLRWKVYAEAYPGNCFKGESSGAFARKHVPFLSFTNVTRNPVRCQNIVSAASFDADFASGNLPEFSMYIPDLNHDGHDTDLNFAGRWMNSKFGSIFSHPQDLKDVLFIVTFDESEGAFENQIYTVLIGNHVVPGSRNTQDLNHIALLKMIEDEFQIGNLGREDLRAPRVENIWR